jgi:tetratricopeptide (TPR) repeat protein
LLVNVAVGYLKAGNIELADRTLDLVHDKAQISNCLLAYSQEFLEEGDAEESNESLEESYAILKSQSETEIRDTNERYRLFSSIAAQFANLEKYERAIEIAQENIDTQQKNLALTKIAQIATMKENDAFARQALQAINEESSKLHALVALSDVKNNLNHTDEALEFLSEASYLVDTVEQFIVRTEVENDLAARFYQCGETEKAREMASKSLRTIEEIKGDENRSAALAQLSDIYDKFNFTVSAEDKSILDDLVKTSEFS